MYTPIHAPIQLKNTNMNDEISDDDDDPASTIPQAASSPHHTESGMRPPQKRFKYDDFCENPIQHYALLWEEIDKNAKEKEEITLRHPNLDEIELNTYISNHRRSAFF